MEEEKFTKGDWIVNSSCVKANWPMEPVVICEVNLILPIQGKRAPREEQIANLKLIAAAPKMLAALKKASDWIDAQIMTSNDISDYDREVYNDTVTAIKLATE